MVNFDCELLAEIRAITADTGEDHGAAFARAVKQEQQRQAKK